MKQNMYVFCNYTKRAILRLLGENKYSGKELLPSSCFEGYRRFKVPGGTWWELVGPGETWWELVGPGETWWNLVRPGGTWWDLVGPGGILF